MEISTSENQFSSVYSVESGSDSTSNYCYSATYEDKFSFSPHPIEMGKRSIVNIDYQNLRVDVLGSYHNPADLTALTESPSWIDEVKNRANIKDNGLILTILKTGFWGFVGTFATLVGQSWTGEVRAAQKVIKNPSSDIVRAVVFFQTLGIDFRTVTIKSTNDLVEFSRTIESPEARGFLARTQIQKGKDPLHKEILKHKESIKTWCAALELVENRATDYTAKQAVVATAIDNLTKKASDRNINLTPEQESYLVQQTLSLAMGPDLIGDETFSDLKVTSSDGTFGIEKTELVTIKGHFQSSFITAYAASIAAELQLEIPKANDSKEKIEEDLKTFKASLRELKGDIELKAYAFAMAHYVEKDIPEEKIEQAAKVIERAIWDALFENEDFSKKLSEAVEGDEGLLKQINDLRDFESVQKKAGDAFLQTFSSLSTSYDENYNRSHAETFLNLSKQFAGTVSTHPQSLKRQDEMGVTWRGLDNHILDLFEKVDQINQLRENQEEKIVTTEELQRLGFSVRDDDPVLQKMKVEDGYDLTKLPDYAAQGIDINDLRFLGFDVADYNSILTHIHRDGKVYLQDLAAFFYEGTGHEEGQVAEADYAFKTAQTLTRIRRTFRDAVLVLRKDTERPERMVASYDHQKCEAKAEILGNYMTEIQQLKDKAHNTAIVEIDQADTEQQQKKDRTRNKTLNALDIAPNVAPDPGKINKPNNLKSETYAKAFMALLSGEKTSPSLAHEMICGIGPKELAQHLSPHNKKDAEAIECLLANLTSKKQNSRGHQLVVQLDESKQICTGQREFNPEELKQLKAILARKEVASNDQEEVREVEPEKLEEAVNSVEEPNPRSPLPETVDSDDE